MMLNCLNQTWLKQNKSRLKSTSGFTLLELLVAITILGLVVGIIFSALRLGIKAWLTGERRGEQNQQLQAVVERMSEEIKSALTLKVTGEVGDMEKKFNAFIGKPDQITFITSTAGWTSDYNRPFPRAVSYFVTGDQGLVSTQALMFSDFFAAPENTEKIVELAPEIVDISFRYYYLPPVKTAEEEEESEGEWLSDWDPTDIETVETDVMEQEETMLEQQRIIQQQLPRAVEITLTVSVDEEGITETLPPLVVPIFVGENIMAKESSW